MNTAEEIVEILRILDGVPAPHGGEAPTAVRLAAWCAKRWPQIEWTVRRYGETGANLVAAPRGDRPGGTLLYSHLDTSLGGDPLEDRPITGRTDDPGPLTVADGRVEGFGLGVARGPAAAAVAGFVTAALASPSAAPRLLLAGSGTHRSTLTGFAAPRCPAGVDHFLTETTDRPAAAVVAKCGPPALLWEEPGALYLRLRVRGGYGAVLARESARPPGGVIASAAPVLEAIGRWRTTYLASSTARPDTQVGPAAGLGSLTAGLPGKPDLFPALLEAGIYVVTVPGARPDEIASALEDEVRAACAMGPLTGCAVEVDHDEVHPAAATAWDAPIVRAARAAWLQEFGTEPPTITGWTGSTDGVVLRAHGIDTVRLGPAARPLATDPRRDVIDLGALTAYARLYTAILRG